MKGLKCRGDTTKRSRSVGELEAEERGGEEEEKGEGGGGGSLKTKLGETQEELKTSSDEADAQRREEEAGGSLVVLTLEVLDIHEDVKTDGNRKMDGSSDWSGRGSRNRGCSTSLSGSVNGAQLDELMTMIQSLAVEVQTSTLAANATADAVAALGEEAKREQAATASAVAAMEVDVRRVVTKVENFEEEVSATKKCLRRQTREWKGWRERFRNMRRRFSRWKKTWQTSMLELERREESREGGKQWKMSWERGKEVS